MTTTVTAGRRIGRWTLQSALGVGSFGSAWKAVDDHGRVAAIKLLGGPPGSEVEALARVCHPAVPSVLDAQGEPTPFMAMSLAQGRTLTQMVRGGRAPESAAVAIGGILADALSVLHAADLPHGDIKPDNVVVGSVKRSEVMLVDFGLAGGDSGGTLHYAAPERLRGGPPSGPADVYALGLLLWEMLVGRLPFADGGVSASLVRRRAEAPVLEGHSPWITDLVSRMLAPDPAHRPNADVVTDTLAAHGAVLPRITGPLVRRRARTVHVPLAAVDAALERWIDSGGSLQICGRRRLGRSHALSRAITTLQARGATWLRMSSTPQVWGAIGDALADPALPGAPVALPDAAHTLDRAEAAAAALEERAPGGLALLVADLDSLDAGSLATVQALVRRGSVSVCAAGTEPLAWMGPAAALRPFDGAEVTSLIGGILGVAEPHPGLVERAMTVSGGVPGVVVEFIAAAFESDALVRRAQRWLVDESRLDALVARDALVTAAPFAPASVAARLGGLLAAAGSAVPLPRLQSMLDLRASQFEGGLQELVDTGYVQVEQGQARCASRAAGAALKQSCGELAAFHRLLAKSLMDDPDAPACRLGWHIVGGADAAAVVARGAAILDEVLLLDPGEAARLSDSMWALAPDPSMVAARVEALQRAGRVDEAVSFAEEQLAAHGPVLAVQVALARAHLACGDGTEAALAVSRAARAGLDGAPAPLSLELVEVKALFRADDVQASATACCAIPPISADASSDMVDDWLAVQVVHAQSLHRLGSAADAVAVLDAVPPRLGYGRPARALLDASLGRLLYHAGRFVDAANVMARAAGADAGLSALDRARMLNNAGLVSYQCGRRLRALEHWEAGLLLFERLGAILDQIRVSVNLCVGYREAGRWERARQAGAWAAVEAGRRDQHDLQAMAAGNMGDLFLDQRRYTEAERWYLQAHRVARTHDLSGELVELARRQAELAVLRDDADALVRSDEALRMAEAADETVESCRARALRAVCLARRNGNRDVIRELLEAAEEPLRAAGAAGELASVRLLAAEAWVAVGDAPRAVGCCDKVVAFAEEMGHVSLRTRADHLLATARELQMQGDQDHRLDLLVSLAVAVARRQDDEAGLLQTVAEAALELLAGERAFVILSGDSLEDGRPDLRVVAAHTAAGVEVGAPSMSVVRRVLDARTEVIAADLSERGDLREAKSVMAFSLRSAMCVPMLEGNQVLGAIYVDSQTASEEELSRSARFMRALAAHASVAVTNARRVQAIKERAAWAAEVAHDMRSPVSSIITLAATVREDPSDTELVGECMDDMLVAGRRCLAMAERFLGDGSAKREPVEVGELIREVGRTLSPLARARGVAFAWHGGEGDVVLADSVELCRVLVNLGSNAVKYSDPGGHVTLQADIRGGRVRITVRDQGAGIPDDALAAIFERGVQAPGARSGHGIGLSVAHRMIEAHGGDIVAANHPDGGAQFTVTLPLHVAASRRAV